MSAVHAAVVLAAGGSTRLGQPKQLLSRQGEPLVRRSARLALETLPRQLLVVAGAGAGDVAAALRGLPCEIVLNAGWRAGLGSSLRAAAAQLGETDLVLVCGCDQPALELHHLQALLQGARALPTRCAATRHGDVLGVPAVLPRDWFDGLRDGGMPDIDGARGFGGRLRRLPAGSVHAVRAPELELDVDTPDDLRRAREHGWLDPVSG